MCRRDCVEHAARAFSIDPAAAQSAAPRSAPAPVEPKLLGCLAATAAAEQARLYKRNARGGLIFAEGFSAR
jgi:hypothetical protein